jgi:hypothetical protein
LERPTDHRIAAGLAAAADAAVFLLLILLVLGRIFYRELGLPRDLGWDRMAVIAIVAGLVVLRRRAAVWRPNKVLAALVTLVTAALGLLALPAYGVSVSDAIKEGIVRVVYRPHAPERIYRLDDRFGYVLVPGAEDFERTIDYTATYTIDSGGRRLTSASSQPDAPVIAVVGDSFTFGQGVENDETYVSRLAAGPWRRAQIMNYGVGGWGLTQMFLRVTELLRDRPPHGVIVALIGHDLRRSHLRPPLVTGQTKRLEFIDGAFVSRALDYRARAVAETPELLEQEARLAEDILLRMARACREHQVAFAVVFLHTDAFPPRLAAALGNAAVPVLDLTRLQLPMYQYDAHPTAAGHRRIAEAMQASFLTEMLRPY